MSSFVCVDIVMIGGMRACLMGLKRVVTDGLLISLINDRGTGDLDEVHALMTL